MRYDPFRPTLSNECGCGGKIIVSESESRIIEIDEKGRPVSFNNYQGILSAKCDKCGDRFTVVKVNNSYIIKERINNPLRDYMKNREFNPCGYY